MWLGTVVLPSGGRTTCHVHDLHESALYMVEGDEVELWTGDRLENREVVHPGDYLFVPPGLPHVAINRTGSDALFVAARTDPDEQETVRCLPELDSLIP